MTAEPRSPGQRTVAELRAVTAGFRLAISGIDVYRQEWGASDREAFSSSSPAASDYRAVAHHVHDLLSLADVRIAAALDTCDALARLGESAASGAPTPSYVGMTIGRSAIETLATAHWLLEPDITADLRAGRELGLNRYEIKSQQALGAKDLDDELRQVDDEALELGLIKARGRRGDLLGFGEAFPSMTARVRSILGGEETAYSLMSAASHGETWALVLLGFSRESATEATWGLTLRKAPPASGLWYPVTRSLRALMACAWREAAYRGWRLTDLARVGEDAYTTADFDAGSRFWHV